MARTESCGIIFMDPDIGIARSSVTPSHASASEIADYVARGQTVVTWQSGWHMKRARQVAELTERVTKHHREAGAPRVLRVSQPIERMFWFVPARERALDIDTWLGAFHDQWGAGAELVIG